MTRSSRIGLAILAVVCAASFAAVSAFGQEHAFEGGSSGPPPTPAIGEPIWLREELVFTPVAPCRLIDTRNVGGPFGAGETRAYDLIGPADYSSIGGSATGCGIPADLIGGPVIVAPTVGNRVRALALNIIAVGPTGAGDFRAWPSDEATPAASVINYANVGGGLNIANGIILKTCGAFWRVSEPSSCLQDLSFLADVAGSHLVVDVLGYFVPASVGDVQGSSGEGIAANTSITDGLCHSLASVTLFNSAFTERGVVCTGSLNLENTHATGTATQTNITLATDATTCDTSAGPPLGVATWQIPSAYPSASAINLTLTTARRFTLFSQTSGTFRVNAQRWSGSGASGVTGGNLVCVLDQ